MKLNRGCIKIIVRSISLLCVDLVVLNVDDRYLLVKRFAEPLRDENALGRHARERYERKNSVNILNI